jgi:hypothetical protein
VTKTQEPADNAGLGDSFGDFVVACESIVKSEARRLSRGGLRADAEDIEQESYRILLEEKETIAAEPSKSLVRMILRRRLVDIFVRRGSAAKRNAIEVSAEEIAHAIEDAPDAAAIEAGDGGRAVDQATIEKMSVPSHEDDCIDRVSFGEVHDFIGFLQEPETRQAQHERRRQWIPRMQKFVTRRSAA